jgi:hypothetical protein
MVGNRCCRQCWSLDVSQTLGPSRPVTAIAFYIQTETKSTTHQRNYILKTYTFLTVALTHEALDHADMKRLGHGVRETLIHSVGE